MPNSVKGFLKVYEYVVDVSLVLLVFLTQNTEVEDLFRGAASHSKACLFLCDDVFGLSRFKITFSMTLLAWLIRLIVRKWKFSSSRSWSLPMSAPGKLRVFAVFTLERNRCWTRM